VADVAVVGVPDALWGDAVLAFVVVKAGQEATPRELTSYCAERLAAFKRPVKVTILPEIPKGPTGKIQRRNLSGLVGGA